MVITTSFHYSTCDLNSRSVHFIQIIPINLVSVSLNPSEFIIVNRILKYFQLKDATWYLKSSTSNNTHNVGIIQWLHCVSETHSFDGLWIELSLLWLQHNQPFTYIRCLNFDSEKGSTLIISLCWLWDADSKLAAIRIDAHHATVSWGAGESRDLAGIPGDAVESFCNVRGSLQNDVLQDDRLRWVFLSSKKSRTQERGRCECLTWLLCGVP